jgi:hypothetical protein
MSGLDHGLPDKHPDQQIILLQKQVRRPTKIKNDSTNEGNSDANELSDSE